MNVEQVKAETLRLYHSLPQEKEERMQRLDVRDKVIELNYSFFGYVASHTFISNTMISYEDKLQSALMHFCECWWWYLWEERYRTDLSFSVFFKLRLSEMIKRELNTVKNSVRRSLLIQAGDQLGKHWAKVRYEDLNDIDLPVEKMNALKAIFGVPYNADLEEHALFIEAPKDLDSGYDYMSTDYDNIEELLIREMIDHESKLNNRIFNKMSDMYGIKVEVLKEAYPRALKILYDRLHANLDLLDI